MTARRAGARSVPLLTVTALGLLLAGCGGSDGTTFTETTHPVTAGATASSSGSAPSSASSSASSSATAPSATTSGSPSASATLAASAEEPGTPPPWPNAEHPADSIRAAGLVPAGTEGTAEHYHAHL